jgi:2,3-dihydroxybenzoate decarboxylase
MNKIALEEHFSGPGFEQYLAGVGGLFDPGVLAAIEARLPDFEQQRLAMMDAAGISIAVLSQTAPGVQQEPEAATAVDLARRSNDFLASRIAEHPYRFRGFAAVALQDVDAAIAELQRSVTELGFVGVLVNGNTCGHYLDEPQFDRFWSALTELQVPLYLHPGLLVDEPAMFAGRPELNGATWSWTCETASHALRLVFGGVFLRHPTATVILGHMGETLPFDLWRLDSRALTTTPGRAMPKPPSQQIREHILITTSGVCSDAALRCSLTELGPDRVLFATDYPYEDAQIAADWIDRADIDGDVRQKVCWDNAAALFGICAESTAPASTDDGELANDRAKLRSCGNQRPE